MSENNKSVLIHAQATKNTTTGDEMATGTCHGRLIEFDVENETITAYLERVELYFDANDVVDDKQVPVLLSNIGAKTYRLLGSPAAAKAPNKTLDDIKKLLKSHFEPILSVIAKCTDFIEEIRHQERR